ncbi:MAG: hypothetical protein O7G29_10260, partial [Acidobacteria bacterium]|nr:hypothetical protein [Acidobacteriota bacterium]
QKVVKYLPENLPENFAPRLLPRKSMPQSMPLNFTKLLQVNFTKLLQTPPWHTFQHFFEKLIGRRKKPFGKRL